MAKQFFQMSEGLNLVVCLLVRPICLFDFCVDLASFSVDFSQEINEIQ